ncbi:hypothetical protein CRM22_001029 [Opisthorchis felineus]|uniref:Glutamine amidotransferase type-2 domain-containing protein n=2 Tax=Opisthorchis felineus TaxID=147828 RepID=A0A4S2MIK9_OPIFE|nr:hypothetical protein CRM22_001029 [Opisthorchis felineus]
MCGIALLSASDVSTALDGDCTSQLQSIVHYDFSTFLHRGPDFCSCKALMPSGPAVDSSGLLAIGCILSQRGSSVTIQPLSTISSLTNKTYYLLWNGEVFHFADKLIDQRFHDPLVNDADILLSLIRDADTLEKLLCLFSSIQGPFAFILIEFPTNLIYFGRDPLGRRSLVARCLAVSDEDSHMVLDCISSVVLLSCSEQNKADEQGWIELPASGVYTAQLLHTKNGWCFTNTTMYPWSKEHLEAWSLSQLNITKQIGFVLANEEHFPSLPPAASFDWVCEEFLKLLCSAVRDRVRLASSTCTNCSLWPKTHEAAGCGHSRFGVLFSGGLDSTVIAALCDRFIPSDQPIDLINVAFEQSAPDASSKITNSSTCQKGSTSDAPDRQTAWQSFRELCSLSPNRNWQLVLVDVPLEELRAVRSSYIKRLLLPNRLTVLDVSLGLATWFAARGTGHLVTSLSWGQSSAVSNRDLGGQNSTYCSPAKVVFVGTGVDEQLAGYSRHRITFQQYGPEALEKELVMEMRRISERNLGRDDRIISDHGREARFPYLDERVTRFLRQLPIHLKADLTLPRGVGEKRLLRQVAHNLGLLQASTLSKRAMQFGSRIAKAEGSSRLLGSADKIPARLDA